MTSIISSTALSGWISLSQLKHLRRCSSGLVAGSLLYMKHTILITGAAGYVGAMLVEQFAKREDVGSIIGIDKEPMPENFPKESKLAYLHLNTVDDWEEKVRVYHPTVIIHTAWQIREMYGAQDVEWKWNIGGAGEIFYFALSLKK